MDCRILVDPLVTRNHHQLVSILRLRKHHQSGGESFGQYEGVQLRFGSAADQLGENVVSAFSKDEVCETASPEFNLSCFERPAKFVY